MKINNLILLLIILSFSYCSSQKTNDSSLYNGKIDKAFKEYLINNRIPFKKLNDSVYDAYFSNYLANEKKIKLKSNLYLKLNKVYVSYRTPNSVEFTVYSDNGRFCLNTYDLDMDGIILSLPENGIINVVNPIKLEDFGSFEIAENMISTRVFHQSAFRNWYSYINGTIENDTIYFIEKYLASDTYKFKKKFFKKSQKMNSIEVYQPNLKAIKYTNNYGLVYYIITGSFEIETKLKNKIENK